MTRDRIALLWRAAVRIREQLEQARAAEEPPELPRAAWRGCRRMDRLQRRVQRRGWQRAHGRVRDRLRRAIDDCRRQLEYSAEDLVRPPRRPASTGEIFQDLAALDEEFCEAKVCLRETEVVVLTEPIVLEGVHLGPFHIVLDWSRLTARSGAYSIVGGSPASSDDDVMHPHVREGTLCEGEAGPALKASLAAGRLFDFFVIVARTLATYNAENAFVELSRWHGVTCGDCGGFAADDYASSCERCECDLCDDCGISCEDCGHTACADCSAPCAGCQDSCCGACLSRCVRCTHRYCERCQTDETCNSCRAEIAAQKLTAPAGVAPTAADALCVGEVGLHA